MASGGYRPPANPAAVSGPGALSKRTDGKQPIMDLPNAGYGQNAQFRQDQAGGPMPSTPPPSGPPAGPEQSAPTPMPLSGGSMLPAQPVTHGADAGPGPDSSSLKLGDPTPVQHASALSMVQGLAASPNASPALRFLATQLSGGF